MSPLGIALGVPWFDGIFGTPTPIPYSLQFDGVNDYVDLSTHIASLDFNAPASISFWVKLTGSHKTTGGCIFALSDNSTPFFTVGFGSFSGVWVNEVLSVRYISDGQSVNNGVAFIDSSDTYGGNWYHCVATCSGSAWVLYLNAVSKTLTNYNSNTGKYGDSLTALKASIGNLIRSGGNVLYFPGYIDQFSIWNKVLSAAEVSEIYALKPSSVPDYSTLSFWANRVIWLPIGESPDVWGTTNGIKDLSGNGLNGTMNNFDVSGSFSTDVARDSSLYFDGVNDYVDLSTHIASLDFNAPATISAWVKLVGSHKTTGGSIFTLSNFGATANFTVGFGSASGAWTNEVLSVRYLNDSGSVNNGVAFVDATDSYAGNWYHIVATCSGSAWKLYMNAVDKTLTNFTSNTGKYGDGITASKASIGILMRSSGNLIPFPGYIDQFSIWNKALSAAEVSELYALKPSSIPDYSTLSFWANRVIWNPIGETGDTWGTTGGILDYSGNNYHGTMNNFDVGGSFSTDVAT